MTKLGETVEEDGHRFGRARYRRDAVTGGHRVNPLLWVLGALVLGGYLLTGHLFTPAAATDEPTFSSPTDLLRAAFGAALALAWAVFGSWLGMRRARRLNALHEPAGVRLTTGHPSRTAYDSLRAPTCERMYDETRLVPRYLRSVEFPATKHELVRLAKEHTDEGQALRRLECIPDRSYSSLHDLITEIRCD